MIAEKSEGAAATQPLAQKKRIPWIRLLLSLLLSGWGLWFVTRDISAGQLRAALSQANLLFIALGVLIIAITSVAKAWRWQILFYPRSEAPSFPGLFWALSIGQLVNTAVPFLRLGEVARVFDLHAHEGSNKARALGTLVVEKLLDLIMLAVTLFLLLPFLVIPTFVTDSGTVLAAMAVVASAALYAIAFKTELALRVLQRPIRLLPDQLQQRIEKLLVAGLRGLSALRSPGTTLTVLGISALIALLSVLTPWVLFPALGISLGLVAASAIHVVLIVGTLPPSTPARVGVFEFLVAFMLRFFGVEDSVVILTYTIVYHLVVVIPQIVFGGIAAARGTGHGAS